MKLPGIHCFYIRHIRQSSEKSQHLKKKHNILWTPCICDPFPSHHTLYYVRCTWSADLFNHLDLHTSSNKRRISLDAAKLNWAFKLYDVDNDGMIDIKEMAVIMETLDSIEGVKPGTLIRPYLSNINILSSVLYSGRTTRASHIGSITSL